jgi:cob(I)alamin adenosyltransferase
MSEADPPEAGKADLPAGRQGPKRSRLGGNRVFSRYTRGHESNFMKESLGKIHVYTGEGKGKTQAALGLALRALGHGYKVIVIQFMKGADSGENLIQTKLAPDYEIYHFGRTKFIKKGEVEKEDIELAKKGLIFAKEIMQTRQPDILILDELNVALDFKLLGIEEVLKFLNEKPSGLEIVLTGRNAKKEIIDQADLVTDMKKVKHYYDKGLRARLGVEY